MRILVGSDLHGSPESLDFLIAEVKKQSPDMVVLLGDLLYHGPRNPLPGGYGPMHMPDAFRTLASLCNVVAVRGNCDAEIDLMLMPFAMPESAIIEADGLQIFACHGHHIPEVPPMKGFRAGTVFLRGHTHIPRGESIDGFSFWNPGSMTLPKRGWPRSYGYIENGCFKVLSLTGETLLEHTPII